MKNIAVCVNLDTFSLGSGWKLPPSDDPTYRLVDERLMSRFLRADIRTTLFVVGRDLASPRNRALVKKWSSQGHEIGNHTFSHPLNLASLTKEEMEVEIEETEHEIKSITGEKPIGFNAPGWAISREIDDALSHHGYRYDLSLFASWWLYPLLLKQWWSVRRERAASTVWRRKDILYPLVAPFGITKPPRTMIRIPLPTATPVAIPVWHTGWFLFGNMFARLLRLAAASNPRFYYLMHPMDVMDQRDIPRGYADCVKFERIGVSVRQKMEHLDLSLKLLSPYRFVTASELAGFP